MTNSGTRRRRAFIHSWWEQPLWEWTWKSHRITKVGLWYNSGIPLLSLQPMNSKPEQRHLLSVWTVAPSTIAPAWRSPDICQYVSEKDIEETPERVVFSCRKEWGCDICREMKGTGDWYVTLNEPDPKRQIWPFLELEQCFSTCGFQPL